MPHSGCNKVALAARLPSAASLTSSMQDIPENGNAMYGVLAARLCATADQRNRRRRGASHGVIDAAVQP
ncbi:hypothetical protein CVIRNUC_007471 [Coccomyxa viridis]|uniref:Uncharacterized protein n=1 Tax=Coccomyxa viridis TaxID=1274662 RepID=A0AAV1IC28_9CHLO|nr:hypothetical protein CVIRNUC_007471 [Coccomyxa viridis]